MVCLNRERVAKLSFCGEFPFVQARKFVRKYMPDFSSLEVQVDPMRAMAKKFVADTKREVRGGEAVFIPRRCRIGGNGARLNALEARQRFIMLVRVEVARMERQAKTMISIATAEPMVQAQMAV